MQRKTLTFLVAGFVSLVLIFVLSLNVLAAYDSQTVIDSQSSIQTDKSDRTLLKDIIINQRKTHALLREIKASLAK